MDFPDHRRIGRQLDVFASDEMCGAGLPLWLPAGAAIRGEIERYIVELERLHGYQHVYTPELAKRELFERSGHWAHYRDEMYPPMRVGGDQVLLRPMNCPHHILVFQAEARGARDIPYRLAELGTMFRLERSGVVSGLSRVRQATLNDGHIFCAPDQVEEEIGDVLGLVDEAYRALAIPPPSFRLSLKGDGPKYVGDPEVWARSEAMLRSALANHDLEFAEADDEAAFYGPKIDLQVTDPQGREETLSTVQLDFHLPARFDLTYQHGSLHDRPVMVHRSIVATMERMVGHLLEVHNGSLPVWLAPTQVAIIPIVADAVPYATELRNALRRNAIRVLLDDRDATLAARIRDAEVQHVPFLAIVGRREADELSVAVRLRDRRQLPPLGIDEFIAAVRQSIVRHSVNGL